MKSVKGFNQNLKIDPNEPGLIAGYNMIPNGVTVPDVSGNGNNGTISGGVIYENGELGSSVSANGSTGNINLTGLENSSQTYTFSMWIKGLSTSPNTNRYLFHSNAAGGQLILAWYSNSANNIGFFDGTWKNFGTTPTDNVYHNLVWLFDSSNTEAKLYVDGVQLGNAQTYSPIDLGPTIRLFSNFLGTNWFSNVNMSNLQIYDYLWSEQKIEKEYQKGFKTDSNLVAACNMKPNGKTIADLSGNGNHGTISGGVTYEKTLLGGSLKLNGVDGVINYGTAFNSVTDIAISSWCKFDNVTNLQLVLSKFLNFSDNWGVRVNGGELSILDDIDNAGSNLYATTIETDVWYHIVAILNSSLENKLYLNGSLVGSGSFSAAHWDSFAGNFYIGTRDNAASFLDASISNVFLLTEEPSSNWVEQEYNKGKKALWKTENGIITNVSSTGGSLVNSPVYVDSGEFKFSNDTINGKKVKVLECVSSGVAYIPTSFFNQTETESAYGEWKFFVYSVLNNTTRGSFISSDFSEATPTPGYRWQISVAGLLLIENGGATLIDGGSVTQNQYNKVKIIRKNDGEFELFLNDSSVGTAIDTTTTSSFYFQLDLDTGDKIAWSSGDGEIAIEKRLLP